MLLNCIGYAGKQCGAEFEADTFRGYCDACKGECVDTLRAIANAQRPYSGVRLTGKFAPADACPKSVPDPVTQQPVCGLCGSGGLDSGFGHTGYGMGVYSFCEGCKTFIDFVPDPDEEE